jgi:hypothetical protein
MDPPDDPTWILPPPTVPVLLRIGGLEFPTRVEMRRRGPSDTSSVGLRLVSPDVIDRVLITRAYQRSRYPSVGLRGNTKPALIDELMTASGYTALREGAQPVEGWHVPPGDERLSIDLVYQGSDERPLAHVSCSRAYPNTWIYHQLATVADGRHRAAYALYILIVEWVLTLASERGYAMAYFDQSKKWHQTLFADFIRWAGSDSLSVIASLDRLERIPGGRADVTASTQVQVRPARDADRNFLVRLARGALPELVADALHIDTGTVLADPLCAEHQAAGLERARSALVVEVDGVPCGAALCETGSRRLSLFNILNVAYVFVEPGRCGAPAQAALLSSVLAFYEGSGVTDPLVVSPAGTFARPEAAGLRIVEAMGLWAASTEGLKEWRNYVHLALGFRASRTSSNGPVDRCATSPGGPA